MNPDAASTIGMRQDLQVLRQIEPARIADGADDEQDRVQPDTAGPAERGGKRDQLPGVEVIHVRPDRSFVARNPRRAALGEECGDAFLALGG